MSELEDYEVNRHRGSIYDVPRIGGRLREVREFYDGMQPRQGDSTGVVVGKQIARYGTVAATTAAGLALGCIVAL